MSNKDNGGPAFPVAFTTTPFQGMTLRDHFAGLAMQAIRSKSTRLDDAGIAKIAYAQADAMLEARK